MSTGLSPTASRVMIRLRRLHRFGQRVRVGPALVRTTAVAAGTAALLVPMPPPLMSGAMVAFAVVVATLAAALPRSTLVTVLEVVSVVEWVAHSLLYGYAVSLAQLIALTAVLYLHHTTSALAAVLPIDAVSAPTVLLGWLGRTLAVVVLSVVLGLLALSIPRLVGGAPSLWAPLLGLATAIGVAFVIAYELHRRDS